MQASRPAPPKTATRIAGAACLLGATLLAVAGWGPAGTSGPELPIEGPVAGAGAGTLPAPQALADAADRMGYIGAGACQGCHPRQHAKWSASRHSRMVQPVEPGEVKASFTPGQRLEYRGRTYTFERRGPRFFIIERRPGQAPVRHPIEHTLGNRRIQHYLTRQVDGSLVLLPPTWDVRRREWFPQEEIVPTGDPDVEPVQVWNKNCFGCHVSQERKRFDTDSLTYATDWLDPGTNCETCHGPAADHAEFYRADATGEPPPVVDPGALDARRFTQLCAQCHQNRYLLQPGYQPGEPFYDHFLTALPYTVPADAPDPGYWADGRTRRFSNNSFGLWQSACYLEGGVRCLNCHLDPHLIDIEDNPQLQPGAAGSVLCAGCHESIVESVERHSRHLAGSEGSSCLACHMPRTVSGVKGTMRDHSLAVPVPENTRDHGIPNACNLCHERRGPEWAAERIRDWYGELETRPRAMKLRRRAAAFSAAQQGERAATDLLVEILRDPGEPFLMRASAAGYLRAGPGEDALTGLWDALVDPHPLVRAVAPLSIAEHPRGGTLQNDLVGLLSDPSYAVRINTAFALARLGFAEAEGLVGEHLSRAQREYLDHLQLYADSPEDQANRGAMLAVRGELEAAVSAYRVALRLDPGHRDARFGLGIALLRMGSTDEAVRELERLRERAPTYPGLAELLARISRARRRR